MTLKSKYSKPKSVITTQHGATFTALGYMHGASVINNNGDEIPITEQMVQPSTSVGRRKDMQDIGVHSKSKSCVVTLLVISKLLDLLGAPRACVDFCDPNDVLGSTSLSRINPGMGKMSE